MDKWTLFFIVAVLSSFISAFGVAQLKKRHPEKYRELGEPKPYWNGTSESYYYVSFVISLRFLSLKDSFLKVVFLIDFFLFIVAISLLASLMYEVIF